MTLTNSGSSDYLTAGSPCSNIGNMDTNKSYTSTTRTFSGSTVAWDVSAETLTITLGNPSGSVSTSTQSADRADVHAHDGSSGPVRQPDERHRVHRHVEQVLTMRTTMRKTFRRHLALRMRGERGTSLVIAMMFLSVFGLVSIAILGFGDVSLRATAGYRTQRAQNYATDAALQAAINRVRNDSSIGRDPGVYSGDMCNPTNTTSALINIAATSTSPPMVVSCQVESGGGSGIPKDLGTNPPYSVLTLGDRRTDSVGGTPLIGHTNDLGVRNTEPGPYNGVVDQGWGDPCGGNRQETGIRVNKSMSPFFIFGFPLFCTVSQSASSWNVTGNLFANSPINLDEANSGPVMVTAPDTTQGTIKARGGCAGTGLTCTDPGWGPLANSEGDDPGLLNPTDYAPRTLTGLTVQSVPNDSGCKATNRLVTFNPGIYTDATALNNLFADADCANATFWFQPGTYYFDFRNTDTISFACGGDINASWIGTLTQNSTAPVVHRREGPGVRRPASHRRHALQLEPASRSDDPPDHPGPRGLGRERDRLLVLPPEHAVHERRQRQGDRRHGGQHGHDVGAPREQHLALELPEGAAWRVRPGSHPRGRALRGQPRPHERADGPGQLGPALRWRYVRAVHPAQGAGRRQHRRSPRCPPTDATNLAACLNNGDKINTAVVQYNVSRPWNQGSPYPTAKLDGARFQLTTQDQPTFPRPPSATDPGGDCDPTQPGVQFIFGGDSHVYVPNGGLEVCAGPNPTNEGTGKQIAVYGVPATPRLVPTAVSATSGTVTGSTNALRIAEGSGLASASISYNGTETLRFPGYSVPAGYSIDTVELRASYNAQNASGSSAPQFQVQTTSGSVFCAATAVASGAGNQAQTYDVSSCMKASNRIASAYDVKWSAKGSGSCSGATCPQLDGIEFIVTLAPTDPNASLRPQNGCLTISANFWYGVSAPDCALMRVDAPFWDQLPGRRGRMSVKGTIYAPSAAIDIDDTDVNYPLASRGLIARHLRIRGFQYASGYSEPAFSNWLDTTSSARQVLFYVCGKSTGVCSQTDSTRKGRAAVSFEAVTNTPTVTNWSVNG